MTERGDFSMELYLTLKVKEELSFGIMGKKKGSPHRGNSSWTYVEVWKHVICKVSTRFGCG